MKTMSGIGLVADIFDVQVVTSDDELFASSTLDSGNINISVDGEEIMAGQGAKIIARLGTARRVEVTLNDKTMNWDFISLNLAQKFKTGAVNIMAPPKYYTATKPNTDVEFKLDHVPLTSGSNLTIIDVKTQTALKPTDDYTIASDTVTLVSHNAGDKFLVTGYWYESAGTAETMEITDNTFPKGCKLILSTIEINSKDVKTHDIQIQIDQAMPNGSFELNLVTQRTVSGVPLSFVAVRPEGSNGPLGRIIREAVA